MAFGERLGVPIDLVGVADDDTRVERFRDHLDALAHQTGHAVGATHVAVDVDPVVPIMAWAAQFAFATVCLASHGRERVAGVLIDSVATELLGATASPVIVVGTNAAPGPAGAPVVALVDGSAASEVAIPVAGEWARRLGVALVVTIVVNPTEDRVAPRNRLPDDPAPFDPDEYVRTIAANCNGEGIAARAHVIQYTSHPAEGLAIYLGRHPAQLVVASARARTGLSRLVFGSVASRMIHESSAPVLVVGPHVDVRSGGATAVFDDTAIGHVGEQSGAPFGTVIVPIDVEHIRAEEVAVARALARMAGARIMLIAADAGADQRETQRRLTDLADELRPHVVETSVVRSADPVRALLAEARAAADSIICLATHAPGLLASALRTTIAGPLMRWSPVPVVLVGPDCVVTDRDYTEVAAFIDGSDLSDAVVALAGRWAQGLGLAMTIAEVVDPTDRPGTSDAVQDAFVRGAARRVTSRHGIDAVAAVVEGARAAPSIVAWTRQHPHALVVLGSHGKGLSEHALGAVVMDVTRHSAVPVVVFPAHGERRWSAPPH